MRLVSDNRASRILYNILLSNSFDKPFILPANVCEVVPQTFAMANVSFVFADIDNDTLCVDFEGLWDYVHHYSGILYVHTYGVESRPEPLYRKLKALCPDLFIIDDACLCLPQLVSLDTVADVVLYSVGPKKQVDMGCGGFAYLSESCNYEHQSLPPDCFIDDSHWVINPGAIMKNMQIARAHKERLNSIYSERLPIEIQLPTEFQNWRFNIFVNNKEINLKALFSEGLFASSHYQSQATAYGQPFCPNVDYLHQHVINLFNDQYYTEDMALRTCEVIKRYL